MFTQPLRRMVLLIGILCLSAGTLFALETSERTIAEDLPVGAGRFVKVENLLGSVQVRLVRKGATPSVKAKVIAEAKGLEEADRLAQSIELLTSQEKDGGVAIHVRFPGEGVEGFRPPKAGMKGFISRWSAPVMRRGATEVEYEGRTVSIRKDRKAAGLAVHLTVTVPADIRTSVYQAAGSIDARYLRGDLDLRAGSGRIDVISCFGNLKAKTDSGDVRIASYQGGRLNVETVSGQVDLDSTRADQAILENKSGLIQGTDLTGGDLRIQSGSGDIRFTDLVPVNAAIRTGSGDIDVALRIRSAKGATVESESGDVTLRMSEKLSFDLSAVSKNGKARTTGMRLNLLERNGAAESFRQGSGGLHLAVSAPQGDVDIRPYDSTRLEILAMRLEERK